MSADVSEDFIREAFAQAAEAPVVLITIDAAGLEAPIRACSEPGVLPDQNFRGVVSRGDTYPHFPFTLAWGGAGDGETARHAKLSIANADGVIVKSIRLATGQPSVTIETVRRADLDTVEQALTGAKIINAEAKDPVVTAEVRARTFADEPACVARYTLSRTPALG